MQRMVCLKIVSLGYAIIYEKSDLLGITKGQGQIIVNLSGQRIFAKDILTDFQGVFFSDF